MNISFLNYIEEFKIVTYDYLYLSLKSYIEDNYRGSSKFTWNYPHKSSFANDIHELVSRVTEESPDVLLVSLYVWNHGLSVKVAELVKKQLPNCIVIFGGPHLLHKVDPLYFKKNWFVDFMCESDGYGEVFMNELLYQLETDKNWNEVPYLIMPTDDRASYVVSKKAFNKRNFVWPRKIFERNADYLLSRRTDTHLKDVPMHLHYESSRGCPFGCTYCEWGGGIATKTIFKPTEYVIEDMEFIYSNLRPEIFSFTDANFGILERDIDIIKKLCEYYDYFEVPHTVYLYGPTKVRKENLYLIERMLTERRMMGVIKIPIQDLNPIVKQNIKRTDVDWKLQLKEYESIRSAFGNEIAFEMILGLPGATLKSFYDSYNVAKENDLSIVKYEWHFLPTAPAARKEYVNEHNIQTVKINPSVSASNTFTRKNIENKNEWIHKYGKRVLVTETEYMEPTEIVVSTYSYTKKEWAEMWFMDKMVIIGETNNYLSNISTYIERKHKISVGDFYKNMWDEFICSEKYLSGKQLNIMQGLLEQLNRKINSETADQSFFFFDIDDCFIKGTTFRLISALKYLVNINRYTFYNSIDSWLQDSYGHDPILSDLVLWNANMIKWIDYTPGQYTFTSEYDWSDWKQTSEVKKCKTVYRPIDTVYAEYDIDWLDMDMKTRVLRKFMPMCSNDGPHSQLFESVEVIR